MTTDRPRATRASQNRSETARTTAIAITAGVLGTVVIWVAGRAVGIQFHPVVLTLVCALAATLWWAHRSGLIPSDAGPAWPDPLMEPLTSSLSETDVTTRRFSHLIASARPDRRFEAKALGLEIARLARQTCAAVFSTPPDAPLDELRVHLGDPLTDYLILAEDEAVPTPPLSRVTVRSYLRMLHSLSVETSSELDHTRS